MNHDPAIEFLDRLDDHWQTAQSSPDLAGWLCEVEMADRGEVASELLLADLEYRFKKLGPHALSHDALIAAEYLGFAVVEADSRLIEKLIEEEFFLRARSQPHSLSVNSLCQAAASISQLTPADWQTRFSDRLAAQHPVVVKLFDRRQSKTEPVLRYSMANELEVGRATQEESTGPQLIDADLPRMVIAHCRCRSISRNQLTLRRLSYAQITVVNQSKKVPLQINISSKPALIDPLSSLGCSLPFSIDFDPLEVRVQTAQAWRPNCS